MPSTRVFGFQFWSSQLVEFKKSLGLPLGYKIDIVIPPKFLESYGLRVAVVRGIFDTDGCVYLEKKNNKLYPRMEITTISYGLSKQLVVVLRGLGLRATVHRFEAVGNRKECYKICVRGVDMFHKFMGIISPANPKHIAKYKMFKNSEGKPLK